MYEYAQKLDSANEPETPYGINKKGFDVIIGNPPYVVLSPNEFSGFNLTKGNNNTYIAFVEKSLELLKQNGKLGFIIPNTWFSGDNFEAVRNKLLCDYDLQQIIQLPYDVFNAYIDTSIVIAAKKANSGYTLYYKYDIHDFQNKINIEQLTDFPNAEWLKFNKIFLNKQLLHLATKVWFSAKNIKLGEISKINRGSLPPKDNEKSRFQSNDFNIKWFDSQVFRYTIDKQNQAECFVNYNTLRENKNIEVYKSEKLLARQLMSRQFRLNVTYNNEPFAFKKNLYAIYDLDAAFNYLYVLSILNSKLFSFIQVNFNTSLQRDDFPAFSLNDFKNFPIAKIAPENQIVYIEKADQMLSLNKQLQEKSELFIKRINANLDAIHLTGKLQNFYDFDFKTFISELKKQKVNLTFKVQEAWEAYFDTYKAEINQLQNQIAQTDKVIDQMVYELYELTPEEVEVVEKSVK